MVASYCAMPNGAFAQDKRSPDDLRLDRRTADLRLPAAPGGNTEQVTAAQNTLTDLLQTLTERRAVPAPDRPRVTVPVAGPENPGTIEMTARQDRMSLVVRDAAVDAVLGVIAQQYGLNLITSGSVSGRMSVTLSDVSLEDALNAILKANGYAWVRDHGIILVSSLSAESSIEPGVQGREVRRFPLNFVAASDVETVVTGLLSPVGKVFIAESSPTDKRKTCDVIVVEDLSTYLDRVAQYIAQADQPPRQVLIEAHILQVDLKDETEHGIDFAALARVAGASVVLSTPVFNTPTETLANLFSPAYNVNVVGTDLLALLEAIKKTTDAKTLASPKALALNGQESRIQVGERLGYFVTTTTQTSTLQEVQFLETGVVLRVTPSITDNNQILMSVKPEVSDGIINEQGLPEERTTEVETTVMLHDGHGMIIGGLIKEDNIEQQSKIPLLGDFWLVGRLFQRRKYERSRAEIIIGLVPRIIPYALDDSHRESMEMTRVTTPLLEGTLKPVDRRPFEAQLPDAMLNPRQIKLRRFPHFFKNLGDTRPHPPEYYLPSLSDESPWMSGYLSDAIRSAAIRTEPPWATDETLPQEPLESHRLSEPPRPDSASAPGSAAAYE